MEIFRADIKNGKLLPEFYSVNLEEDHWIVQGLKMAKQYNQMHYAFNDLGKKPDFVTYIYTDDFDYLVNMCNNKVAQFWLLIGVVHGQANKCEELLENHIVHITEPLKKTSQSFNEEVKDGV